MYFRFIQATLKKSIIFAVLMVFPLTTAPEAATWEHLMQSDNGDNYYVDLDSIVQSSTGMMSLYRKVEPAGTSEYVSLVNYIELDCKDKMMRVLKETLNKKDGSQSVLQKEGEWRKIGADDMDEILLEFICSLKKAR